LTRGTLRAFRDLGHSWASMCATSMCATMWSTMCSTAHPRSWS